MKSKGKLLLSSIQNPVFPLDFFERERKMEIQVLKKIHGTTREKTKGLTIIYTTVFINLIGEEIMKSKSWSTKKCTKAVRQDLLFRINRHNH